MHPNEPGSISIPNHPPQDVVEILAGYCFQSYNGTWEQAISDAQSMWEDIIVYFTTKTH
ncbi:Uncharacterised protein [Klebsiella pneumoniae]|nr:Uncharacterised protein [Klebsiella pneumoniae]